MSAALNANRLDELVSLERGEVDRRIFSDAEIFEQEMTLIFGRAWQFLCHESQIPKAGDFFETPMGRDNVLTVRQRDGSIRAMLNTCTHRGNAVCRAEEGNTKAFMCTYHGWSFDLAGKLIGVPDVEKFYKGDLDKSKYGLVHVAQLESYHGFVFATMDPAAPALADYLGPAGRIAIDLIAAREVEIIPGVQKFTIDCNWKFAVDNVFDWYHAQVTHMSAVASGLFPPAEGEVEVGGARNTLGESLDIPSGLMGNGVDDLVLVSEFGHAAAGPSVDGLGGMPIDTSWRKRPQAVEWLGEVGSKVCGYPNIFPNAWLATAGGQLALRVPVSPNRTEIWWFSFVEKNATPDQRKMTVMLAGHIFGPAGILEQDDGENWAQSTQQTYGHRSRQVPQLLKMGLGRGKVVKENGLARIEGSTSEHAQLWTYHAWAQWMKGLDWDELREATIPPDTL
ncbi:aromatic ring-hydroxylating oxygenase subunit alpha [Amycolatopsis pithecellobii]|nr:Rieske 2Fe-2S domain-containing protein [Amycolatopsis pithecellobii]